MREALSERPSPCVVYLQFLLVEKTALICIEKQTTKEKLAGKQPGTKKRFISGHLMEFFTSTHAYSSFA